MAGDGWKALEEYLTAVAGATCVVPLERNGELCGGGLPDWWTDAGGWGQSSAPGLCREAGWRLESVHPSGAVRFGRIAAQ